MPTGATLSVDDFVDRWRRVSASETQAAQSHFIDLCKLLGVETPIEADPGGVDYTFEKSVRKPDGSSGQADVWKRGHFGWEYKGKRKNLDAAYEQLLGYREGLGNPPLLVVCDMNRFEIHTNFTNTPPRVERFNLNDLRDNPSHYLRMLREVFLDPEALHPNRDPRYITETAAARFGEVAEALRDLDHDPNEVARFLNRLIFCFFAESIGLFRGVDSQAHEPVSLTLSLLRLNPERSSAQLSAVFDAMARREIPDFGPFPTPWFNGGLFDRTAAQETFGLTGDLLEILLETAELDWSRIDPAIFGTLFERSLDPRRRSQLGAHYTDPDNIMRVVEPVVLRPLRREFDALRAELEPDQLTVEESPAAYGEWGTNSALELDEPPPNSPAARIHAFHERLANVRVLDPACGSGNFLYVAMRELKQIEQDLIAWAHSAFGINSLRRRVGIANMLGIDIDQFAVDLTRMSLWIGDIQWTLQQGRQRLAEPILGQIEQIECRDAILAEDAEGNPIPAEWPAAEFIVGNPPFLGGNRLRREIGNVYVDRLQSAWASAVGGQADLCVYWHENARRQIDQGGSRTAALLATNSIVQPYNRKVLENVASSGGIVFAWRDERWFDDGTAVRIAIVGQDDGSETQHELDGVPVARINVDLTDGIAITSADELAENIGVAFRGVGPAGPFDIPLDVAERMLAKPVNVNGRPNSDVVIPFVNAQDLAQRPRGQHVIDFGRNTTMEDAADYEEPFEHVKKHVRPQRRHSRNERLKNLWWLHEAWRPGMRAAIGSLDRFIATPVTSKHRFYVWLNAGTLPASSVNVIARDDDYVFGVLHSRIHHVWAIAQATRLGVGPADSRYIHTQCFNTFPFPWPLNTPDDDLAQEQREHAKQIGAAAASLNDARSQWLNPNDTAAELVQARTMTDLYNDEDEENPRPGWLINRHKAIDEAVSVAYGWSADLSDDEILSRLLALNLERIGE